MALFRLSVLVCQWSQASQVHLFVQGFPVVPQDLVVQVNLVLLEDLEGLFLLEYLHNHLFRGSLEDQETL